LMPLYVTSRLKAASELKAHSLKQDNKLDKGSTTFQGELIMFDTFSHL
jgi:hypothetical protein